MRRVTRLIAALLLLVLLSAPLSAQRPNVQFYSGWWFAWNWFGYCQWQMWVDEYGNWRYTDNCGWTDGYFSLN